MLVSDRPRLEFSQSRPALNDLGRALALALALATKEPEVYDEAYDNACVHRLREQRERKWVGMEWQVVVYWAFLRLRPGEVGQVVGFRGSNYDLSQFIYTHMCIV